MAAEGSPSAMERKLVAASEAECGTGRSALRGLRLALARIAKKLYDLPLVVIGAKQARCEHDGVTGYLQDDRLLMLLDGSNGEAGAVSLDRACVAALTQQQTMGCVTGNSLAERAFTGTDAALAEPLVEALLARAAVLTEVPEDRRCLTGFRYGAQVANVRSLMLALEAERFRVFDLIIDIGEGAMQGAICLVLPDMPEGSSRTGGNEAGPTGPGIEQAFGIMRAELTAMIGRLRLPLSELAAMQPGDVLPMVREQLEKTELVTINGQVIASARLGQINGLRALRLNDSEIKPDLLDHPGEKGFGNRIVAKEPTPKAALTLEGTVAPQQQETELPSDVPALSGQDVTPFPDPASEGDPDNLLDRMTPEEAAAEITQLAGLNAEEVVD